jgi:ubiquinone/menaquinone biosynthesis C-methylase UbiE
VFDQFDFGPGSALLELGCGPATLWVENKSRIDASWRVVLSDFSAGMVEKAQAALAGAPMEVEFRVIDAQSIPYGDGVFDRVVANHMLYHVPDRKKALARSRGCSSRAGCCMLLRWEPGTCTVFTTSRGASTPS